MRRTQMPSLLILLLIPLVSAQLTADNLRATCPNDKEICYSKAAQGECYGNSLKAQVLNKNCPCSCSEVLHSRIQNCCKTVGQPEMKFCLPLCGYNTTVEELGSSLGVKCVSQLTTLAYCAADNNNNTECCKAKGVAEECMSFCKGDVPTCDLQSIFSYQPCLKSMKAITQCQVENLSAEARFDPDWQAPCEWE
ncbi:unnamed protein product [Bursaphelenchus okinawaensis]|uniref:Domain of unknown function DB domain-containing protein n=1 Tax=Bursaphelenchus okinawaensis TaxID=465554 RepID=A0A811K8X4_9BILA|nr:unnamed protein product [Bursaphelenchus okinawaensis]CAG9095286.1 unnamed protein product [Bursaphelenchus okinawaensis]